MPDDELTITFTGEAAARVRFAARTFGVDPSEVVMRALALMADTAPETARPSRNPWEPVPVYGDYEGTRVDGMYLPATKRVTVTTPGPLEGTRYKSPSGAARAVVSWLNPQRTATQTNGWRFWRVAETDERLEAYRR